MSSFSLKYYNISPIVISEDLAKVLMPKIAKHNGSLGLNNQHLFIFSNTKRQNGKYRGVTIGMDKDTKEIVRNLVKESKLTLLELNKTLKQDSKPLIKA